MINEMKSLKEIVNKVFNTDISVTSRARDNVYGRMVFAVIMRERGHHLEKIGEFINKDHSTIVYYTTKMNVLFNQDEILMERYLECKKCFYEDKTPGVYLTTEKKMEKKLIELDRKLNEALLEKQKLLVEVKKNKRIAKIIDIINLHTPEGMEYDVERKVQQMFNIR
jgi:monoamine oxidase